MRGEEHAEAIGSGLLFLAAKFPLLFIVVIRPIQPQNVEP